MSFVKFPGEKIDSLEYPEQGFLICFHFRQQEKWLKSGDTKGWSADTTFALTRHKNLLTTFSSLGDDERSLPHLFILGDQETGATLSYCLEKSKEKTGFSGENIEYLLTDMANNFINAVRSVFGEGI